MSEQTPEISSLPREFRWQGLTFQDPNPQASPDAVRDILAGSYPELATAAIKGPEMESDRMVFTFQPNAGVKG
jgi:PRTRC genetic system protein C